MINKPNNYKYMKKLLLLFGILLMSNMLFGQMNYQFVILDANDEPLENTLIGIQFKIRAGSATGIIVYQETNSILTDEFGRASVPIGTGTPVVGTYAAIDRSGDHFLDVEVDITGGSSYQPFTNSEIFSAFKADESDPVFNSSPAGNITQSDIDNWNNAPTSSVIALDEDNYLTVSVSSNDIIDVRERINLTANYTKLNEYQLFISGGEFKGTGSETISIGSESVVTNTKFSDVSVSGGNDITFINCTFYNVNILPGRSEIYGGRISYSTLPTTYLPSFFTGVEVEHCTIPRVKSFNDCSIYDCTIGNTSYTLPKCNNNIIDDCTIYISDNFSNNDCENTNIIVNDNVQFININGNKFDEELSSGTFILTINRNTTYAQNQIKIANNFFWGETNSSIHIQINGTYSNGGYDSIIHMIGNSFTKGDQVIENNASSIDLIFSNNILNSITDIGVSAGGDIYLISNSIIP